MHLLLEPEFVAIERKRSIHVLDDVPDSDRRHQRFLSRVRVLVFHDTRGAPSLGQRHEDVANVASSADTWGQTTDWCP